MSTVEVQVNIDHLEKLAAGKPVAALNELIWNALDADATKVDIRTRENGMKGLEEIKIIDNGHGLSFKNAQQAFSNLGGSRKRFQQRTPCGRIYHGKQGKGRFRAFCLGKFVEWETVYEDGDHNKQFKIQGTRTNLKKFDLSDTPVVTEQSTGTIVSITEIPPSRPSLITESNLQKITEEFALYLRQYVDIEIIVDGHIVSSSDLEEEVTNYDFEIETDAGQLELTLSIIQWAKNTTKLLYLCDDDGFPLHQMGSGIQAPGFFFTAYLKSNFFRDLSNEGLLQVEGIPTPELQAALDKAKEKMREHFRLKASMQGAECVQKWKKTNIYPYEGEPSSPLENAERQIFDVVALNVNEYLPEFEKASFRSKKMQFKLLKAAIETSPNAVQSIIVDVLNLPLEKQEELAELLGKTSLEAMINASKIVADRLDFLRGLETLVFDRKLKQKTLERKHLHQIVANQTWIFGEEYNLTASDKSLTTVLKRHIDFNQVDKQLLDDETPVLREDGSLGIVDLMLSRMIPQPDADKKHHLIIELKRPKVKIGNSETGQIKDYATAIATDDRFRDTDTRWDFWVLSDELSDSVKMESTQRNRPLGLLLDNDEKRIRIWVKTWGQVITSCQARLRFFQEKLNYAPNESSGLNYLRKVHGTYIPQDIKSSSTTQL